jgi:hypothetical protein
VVSERVSGWVGVRVWDEWVRVKGEGEWVANSFNSKNQVIVRFGQQEFKIGEDGALSLSILLACTGIGSFTAPFIASVITKDTPKMNRMNLVAGWVIIFFFMFFYFYFLFFIFYFLFFIFYFCIIFYLLYN